MKKVITTALLLACLMFSMTGCAKKTPISIGFEEGQLYTMVQYPEGADSFEFHDDTGINFVVKKDGQYSVVVKGCDDNKEYKVVITVQGGKVEIQTDEDSPMSLITK